MARSAFVNLRVYRLAEQLADQVWDLTMRWKIFARDTVGKQIVRSADSIGANIAEGVGRGTYKDNQRFARTARASLYETQHWLRRAFRRKLLEPAEIERLRHLLDNLLPQLNAYINAIGPRNDNKRR